MRIVHFNMLALGAVSLAVHTPVFGTEVSVVVPPPPPVLLVSDGSIQGEPAETADKFQIEVSAEGVLLWAGNLTVNSAIGGSFSQSVRQASTRCKQNGEWRGAVAFTENSDLRVNLQAQRRPTRLPQQPDQYNLDIRWTRPLPDCSGGGTASVSFALPVVVAPGKTVTVNGDAGMVAKLTRLVDPN